VVDMCPGREHVWQPWPDDKYGNRRHLEVCLKELRVACSKIQAWSVAKADHALLMSITTQLENRLQTWQQAATTICGQEMGWQGGFSRTKTKRCSQTQRLPGPLSIKCTNTHICTCTTHNTHTWHTHASGRTMQALQCLRCCPKETDESWPRHAFPCSKQDGTPCNFA